MGVAGAGLALLAVFLVGIGPVRASIEDGIADDVGAALEAAGLENVSVDVSGRDVTHPLGVVRFDRRADEAQREAWV